MNSTALLSIAITLPVITLAWWTWIVVKRVDRDIRADFEGIHFDI